MKPGPRSTHVYSPLPPRHSSSWIDRSIFSRSNQKRERLRGGRWRGRKKENPEPDNIPLKTKKAPSLASFSPSLSLSQLPDPTILYLPPFFSLTFSRLLERGVGVDGRGAGENRRGEGIYGGVAPKGEGLE